ncbi:hypothetical protein FHG89_26035 [Micromonospora orduensis]|uniref:Uncharacterized protein n=1 Tax=Micromonospora orduensis TaxID=1420891 RepID=A0A5C4QH77_9ACTN|nr:hypothetical protein [Micromonospora orduensis]TNH23972.1 hypothetical protein FHG89_26035 [Micromonospora orduensis]
MNLDIPGNEQRDCTSRDGAINPSDDGHRRRIIEEPIENLEGWLILDGTRHRLGCQAAATALLRPGQLCQPRPCCSTPPGAAVPGKAYRAKWSDQLPPGASFTPADDGDAAVTAFTVPADTVPLNTSPFEQGTDIVVAETPRQGTIVAKVTADQGKLEDWYAVTAALAPTAVVQGYREIPTGFDAGAVIVLVTAGLLITAAMGFFAFAMSTVDRRIATRRANVPLAVIGAPRRTLAAADVTESVSGLILGQLVTAAAVILSGGAAAAVLAPRASLTCSTPSGPCSLLPPPGSFSAL